MSELITLSRRDLIYTGATLLGLLAYKATEPPEPSHPFPVGFDEETSRYIRLENPRQVPLRIVSEEIAPKEWGTAFYENPSNHSNTLYLNHKTSIKAIGELYAGAIYEGSYLNGEERGLFDTDGDGFADCGLWYKITSIQTPHDGRLEERFVRAINTELAA